MPWFVLVLAGLFEIGWVIGLKCTDGFTRLWPTVGTVASMVVSLAMLGVGAVGTAILGIVLLGEASNAGRLVSLGLIVAGIAGLKLAS